MDDSRWLRFTAIGLVLAAVAVGYFLFSGRLSPSSITRTQPSPAPTVLGNNAESSPAPTPSPTPGAAYTTIADRAQGGTQILPNTGFPVGLVAVFSLSGVIVGWGLRKFPH